LIVSPRRTTNAAPSVAGITTCFPSGIVRPSFGDFLLMVLLFSFPTHFRVCSQALAWVLPCCGAPSEHGRPSGQGRRRSAGTSDKWQFRQPQINPSQSCISLPPPPPPPPPAGGCSVPAGSCPRGEGGPGGPATVAVRLCGSLWGMA